MQANARDAVIRALNDIEPKLQDLTHLDWSESATTSATGGSYLKARQGEGAMATYYKLSCYDDVNGIYGHECINELIVARLMDVLCVRHVPYRLLHAVVRINGKTHKTWLVSSASYRKVGESKTSLAKFYRLNHLEGETRMDFCLRFGWMPDVQNAMLVDFLIANHDRHGGNLEVLKGKTGELRLAPLFDNGLSLCYTAFTAQQLQEIDPLQDGVSNNFLGSRSLKRNLCEFVSPHMPIARLQQAHRAALFQGLEPALDQAVQGVPGSQLGDLLWNMIWERWCLYESLRDSGRLKAQG